ncbi:fibronectin type III domain-containing protein [Chitinophaga sancti]|uniref:Fibronectin type 3 domain-containing protein n=1 Tax=Chitinophaga sancti TaxID=1004 RepID=A0A1K1SQG5_9BACT|nr:hypothetical protein [Chitinophaga sancti]WQD64392.1 hypothetical protein U0033_08285 [Chitinophaga sancti]WQG89984.1 hypothetical protein SR876_00635 [Chitinophaga sancti]SFW86117.1 fibronectin type 3 domain-containing protein [Chitinophaga sancti]
MYRILLFLLCCCQLATGQEHHIAAIADVQPGVTRLRWAPSGFVEWELGTRYGYNIERFIIGENRFTLLTPQPIKPLPLAQMDPNNEKVAIVAEVIYGEKISPAGKGFSAFYEAQNTNEWRMAMALLACDLSTQAAKSAGLYFEDSDIVEGRRYAYRISLAQQPKNLVVDTAVVVAVPGLLSRPREVRMLCGDKTVTLAWKKDSYSAYIVERSANGKDFHPVSDLPLVSPHFKDTLPGNEHRYFYRIKGITPFADYGPYSEIVSGTGITEVENRPELDTIIVQQNQRIEIRWLLPGSLKDQLAKIVITRAANSKGPFRPIANFNKIAYAFTDQHPGNSNYYRIKGITKQGKAIYSFPYFAQLIDTIPPAVPTGFNGNVDSIGIATLKWKANIEPDLLGYRVFRANSLTEEFVELSKKILSQPAFTDTLTLHTLSANIFYKVIAVDKNYNTSPYSAVILLKRPDTIPPSASLFTKAIGTDTAIVLEWQNSSSEDAIRYILYRVNTKDSSRVQISAWDHPQKMSSFRDTALRPGNTYYYELLVCDAAGNKAIAISSDVFFESGTRPPITSWKAEKQDQHILLHWQYHLAGVKQFRIYRAKSNDLFTLYTTLDGNLHDYTDKVLFPGNVYKYKITAVLPGDVKSAMSKVIEVIY